jgi:acyl-CoA synthetase (AMP-forming)/AMP-acid ligase II
VINATAPHFGDNERTYRTNGAWLDTVADTVATAASQDPDRLALVGRKERFDYGGLDRAIDEFATVLLANGAQAGDAVVLIAANDCRSVIAFHAVRRIGAVCVLVSDHAGPAETALALERTGARLALGPGNLVRQLSDRHPPTVEWLSCEERMGEDSEPFRGDRGAPNSPAVVVFTSGSTSLPKGVLHSINTLRVAARNYIEAAGLDRSDTFFLISPLSSITGVLQALFMAPMLGACTVMEEQWDDAQTFDLLVAEQATFYGGPDVVLRRLLDEAARREVTSVPIRAVSVGGALLDKDLLRRAESSYGIFVMRAYGSSEAPFSTTTPHTAGLEDRLDLDGRPNTGVEVRIGSQGDESECLIRGPHLFLGYLDPTDNDGAFESDWFRTGDIGVLYGEQLKIVGRLKEIVIRNGIKLSIHAVEEAALGLSFVKDAAAFGRPDKETGEHLVLAVRPTEGVSLNLETVVDALLEHGITKRHLPEELIIWDEPFPKTVTEKLNRAALAEQSTGRQRHFASRLES